MSAPPRILVTGAGGPIGVNVTRSLSMLEPRPHLVGTDCNRYHLCLALTDVIELIPPARERAAYLAALSELCERERIDLILPTHPVEVRALVELGEALAVRRFLPSLEVIDRGQNKWQTHQRLAAAGVAVPRTELLRTRVDLERCFAQIPSRPVWVRGAGVPGVGVGVASLPCRSAGHAAAWVDHHDGWGGFIASEYLPGRNLTWLGLFDSGAVWGSQSRERLEYVIPHVSPSGITGAPAVSRTVTEPALRSIGEAAVRAIAPQPHGVYFVDFKCDGAGEPRVTEINAGRFGTTIHFYSAAGANFVGLLVDLALGREPRARLIDPIAPHTYWVRTLDCGPVLLTPAEAREAGFEA